LDAKNWKPFDINKLCQNTMSKSVFDLEFGEDGVSPIWKPSVSMSQHIEQMDKHQDQTYLGEGTDEGADEGTDEGTRQSKGETFKFGMVTDGHGNDYDCINALRAIKMEDMATILGKKRPLETLWDLLKGCLGGATACVVKVYDNRVECINLGDSQVGVYKDGELIYLSKEHNWTNQQERERLVSMNPKITFTPSMNIKVISDTQLVGEYAEYVSWPDGNRLACSQALGDSGKTGCSPDHHVIELVNGSIYKIFIGSDGFWDMINKDDPMEISRLATMSGEDAIGFVKSRWLQPWDMKPIGKEFIPNQQFTPKECDDMCLVCIDISP